MNSSVPPAQLNFVGLMEGVARSEGMTPHAGRILGFLMMREDPVAFSDIASDLGISRGSASLNTALLEEHGLIERLRCPGDRRDHFRFRDDAAEALLERARRRTIDMIARLEELRGGVSEASVQGERIGKMAEFLNASLVATRTLGTEMTASKRPGSEETDRS